MVQGVRVSGMKWVGLNSMIGGSLMKKFSRTYNNVSLTSDYSRGSLSYMPV